ncbi:MAG TPA: iron ABC transporter permease [Magnetospirillaceae bacterium]|nr:iron ABC transporter permease [Magnetospirillaceae bacterium]
MRASGARAGAPWAGRGTRVLLGLAVLGVVLVLSLGMGSVRYTPRTVLAAFLGSSDADPAAIVIIRDLRLARTLVAGLAGAALAVSGTLLQGLFRNPLADPYILGASSGASLGAALALVFVRSPGTASLGAFVGALAAAALAGSAARSTARAGSTTAILLAGTAVSALCSAGVTLLLTLHQQDLYAVFFWLLGSFNGRGWRELTVLAPLFSATALAAFLLARPLDVLACGEDSARALGLDVRLLRAAVIATAALGTAAAVAAGGVIGFVGLAAPHAARLALGPAHSRILPAASLAGAVLLMTADALARTVLAPLELPVGILTALAGAPFFLALLARRDRGWR